MLNSEQMRLVSEDLAITCQTSMICDAGPLPTGFTKGLANHLEAWLRNPATVAAIDSGAQGQEFAAYLERLYVGTLRRLMGYAEVPS